MAAVAKLLDSARLVTLVGAAGVGKTRLAIQVASAAFELHGEGVSLARLAPVDDPSLVAAAVAAAVGVREQPGRSMLQALISHLSSRRLLLRLDNRFRLLSAGSRTAAPRHQSLQAALEWSYDLLCDPERVLLARLSVFAGGFSLEAAEEVCAADDLPTEDVFQLLAGLVAKSL